MYCKKCGKQIDDDSLFCSYCGNRVSQLIDNEELQRQQAHDEWRAQMAQQLGHSTPKKNIGTAQQTIRQSTDPIESKQSLNDLSVSAPIYQAEDITQVVKITDRNAPMNSHEEETICPICHGKVTFQTVAEANPAGCFTYLWYLILALTIWGLLIVIPLMLRNKTKTVTYAVCQNCGHRWPVKRRLFVSR